MDELRILAAMQGGYFTRQDAYGLRFDDRAIARCVRLGLWHRFRRGAYAFTDEWNALDDAGRHRVRCLAVMRSMGNAVVLSGISALLARNASLPTWGLDLSRVHVTRLDGGAGRLEGDVVHHEGLVTDDEIELTELGRVLSSARCVLEAGARAGSSEVAQVLCNSALHAGLTSKDALLEQFVLMQHWPRMRGMQLPVRFADGRFETVGETRGFCLCRRYRLPLPEPQYRVFDRDGVLIATCDWGWHEHQAVGEFDGKIKYGRLLKPGQSAGDVVFAEKQREDAIREIVARGMVRLVWSDYDRPRLTVARIAQRLGIAAA